MGAGAITATGKLRRPCTARQRGSKNDASVRAHHDWLDVLWVLFRVSRSLRDFDRI
jgi:hypothetical protein